MKEHAPNLFFEDDHVMSRITSLDNLEYLSGGKQLRAKFVSFLASEQGMTPKQASLLADTIELIHNATLLHDDVVDTSLERRNSPTLNSIVNNKKAVLFGDYLLAKSIFDLASLENHNLMKAVGIALKRLADGEVYQMDATNPFKVALKDYNLLVENKTGSLFALSICAPFLFSQSETAQLDRFGLNLGRAFQMRDDILDFYTTKKTPQNDLKNNNVNYVFCLLNEAGPKIQEEFLSCNKLNELGASTQVLFDQCYAQANENYQEELNSLSEQAKALFSASINVFIQQIIIKLRSTNE